MKKLTAAQLEKLKHTDPKEWKLRTSIFFVEATSEEQFHLWSDNKYHMEPKYRHDWQQDHAGFAEQIGCVNNDEKMPIWIAYSFAIIDGYRVCFYEATSRFVDHDLVEKHIEKYDPKYDNGKRRAMTNATNFHHVASAIVERKKNENALQPS
jgi:hypothetical protein